MANIFPKWSNKIPAILIFALALFTTGIVAGVYYYFQPDYIRVGYMPTQPVAYDHSLHVDQLGLDCRYCHTYVDRSPHANVPDSGTCMNCHNQIKIDSAALTPIRNSYATADAGVAGQPGEPVPWLRIHKVPDYVYFNHAVHVNRGISCLECHGQINQMPVVYQAKSLGMKFCLDCHRDPSPNMRPLDKVYDLNWASSLTTEEQMAQASQWVEKWAVNPPESCSGCHR